MMSDQIVLVIVMGCRKLQATSSRPSAMETWSLTLNANTRRIIVLISLSTLIMYLGARDAIMRYYLAKEGPATLIKPNATSGDCQ